MIARGLPLVADGAVLVANGKQALSLVAQELRECGVRTLLAPDYYCLTMIEPFQLEGIRVRHLATDERALLDAGALRQALSTGSHQAVLHCEVLGARADASLRELLESARAAGVRVVVDATHSVFGASHDPADYLVASLRKVLPIPDGAFVTGIVPPPELARRTVDDDATQLALLAMQRRGEFVAGRGSRIAFLEAFDAAEDAMLEAREPADISVKALRLLENLDHDDLVARRRANARYLIERLAAAGFGLPNRDTPECGVVVRVDDAEAVERALLDLGIVCPISWPRPAGLASGAPWRSDWITLPVDPEFSGQLLEIPASVVERRAPNGPARVV